MEELREKIARALAEFHTGWAADYPAFIGPADAALHAIEEAGFALIKKGSPPTGAASTYNEQAKSMTGNCRGMLNLEEPRG